KMKIIKNKKHLIISGIVLLVILSLLYTAYNNKAEHYYFLGKAYENQGYFENAKVSYEKSIRLKSNSIVYNALGNLQEYLGENIEAINTFQKGIVADENDVENFFDLGRAYINLKEYNKAEENLLLIAGESASVYALLGTVYIETSKWDKAEIAFKKSLEIQEMALTYNDLGVVYENKGDYNLAIENYQKALAFDPDFELARSNLERLG
ncbi:MAG: tetratricopeptide repeat protein, partial [Nanoarchaeota archaeon]|nr:tetratricopeptide repeat protein [Nanoarchaeota archaeon]